MISSLAPVVSSVESWGISRRTALRTRNRPQIPRLSTVVWVATIPALFILEAIFVLITPVTIFVLVFFRNDSCARDPRNEPHPDDDSRNEPSANVDSRNRLCVEGDFQSSSRNFTRCSKR